ncbi:MAG: diguanylate cyclase domain-containing protein [Lachnospiraceae bacterium]
MGVNKNTNSSKKGLTGYIIFVFVLLSVLLFFIFRLLFHFSRENVLSIGHLNVTQLGQEVEYYLIEEIDQIVLAAKTVEIMLEEGNSNEDILNYLTFESSVIMETIDENYTGLYGYINGEYLDGSGWVPEEDYVPQERPWYQEAVAGNGEVVFVTPYLDSQTNTVMMSVAQQLPDKTSVVSLDMSLDHIQEIVERDDYLIYDEVIITDNRNIVVSATNQDLLATDISETSLIAGYREALAQKGPDMDYFIFSNESGSRQSVFVSHIGNQWNVYLIVKSNELKNSLNYIYVVLITGIVVFVIFAFLVYWNNYKKRRMAENLNNQLESIADIYISVHKFDLVNDTIDEIRCMPYVREQKIIAEETAKNSQEVLSKVMKALVREEHWEAIEQFIDFSTLDERMGSSKAISIEFLGIYGWTKARIIVMKRKNDKITSFLWMVEDIDEEKKTQSELRYLSETDLMTGIRNRGCGERLIKEQIQKNVSGMFCLMDADDFKSINDKYGHDVGDQVIKEIANCLKNAFGPNDIVLRLGGDEFAAFAIGVTEESQSRAILNRFLQQMDEIDIPQLRNERKIELSIGVSFVLEGNEKDFETIYKEADRAAYMSKKMPGSYITYEVN